MTEQQGPERLTFPDLPRLELDELLGQLVQRANEVMATQGRLRGLLRANQLINSGLSLNTLLRRVVEAACDLVGARYGALGVIAPERDGLVEFVHTGMPADAVTEIGHLPEGKGLLGALIHDPQPIRLHRIADDARSAGFPAGHPPMGSFLGVPVAVRGEVFGNLYLAESTKGAFTAEDEELTRALAATAGVAIENARLYESARLRGRWLEASADIAARLLAEHGEDDPLRLVAEACRDIAGADLVAVVVPEPDRPETVKVQLAVGVRAEEAIGARIPRDSSLAGRVLTSGAPLRVADRGAVDDRPGPALLVPLLGAQAVRGVLSLVRSPGGRPFTAEDESWVTAFADQAAVAVELAEARAEQQRAEVLEERQRIAADLHDLVIQRLFADGLTLQAIVSTLPAGRPTDTVLKVIDDLDDTIAQIRTSIFRLQQTPGAATAAGTRARLLEAVDEAAPLLGSEPAVRFSGVLDQLRGAVVDDLVAVLREALSNVARHARATAVQVSVGVDAGGVTVTVEDDGVGVRAGADRSGLVNLRRRAERYRGTLALEPGEGGRGSRLTWTLPDLHG